LKDNDGNAFANEAFGIVSEYLSRKRLATIGVTSSTNLIDFQTANYLIAIDVEFQKLEDKERKSKHGKR
jgi:hypothetical protein